MSRTTAEYATHCTSDIEHFLIQGRFATLIRSYISELYLVILYVLHVKETQ